MKDRIAVFAIMNVVDRHLQKRYIRTTGASIKRRGTHDLMNCIRTDLQKDPEGTLYAYKFDIRRFYDNARQDFVMWCFRRVFKDERLLVLLERFVKLLPEGISFGLRSSQGAGNLLLSVFLDHYLKDKYGVRYYYRYVIRPDYVRLRKRIKQKFARKMHEVKSRKRRRELIASFYGMAKHADCNKLFKKLTGKEMRSFKDLNVAYKPEDGKKRFPGVVVSIRELVNLPIVVKDFETGIKTEQGEDRCIVAIEVNGEAKKFFTNSEEMKNILAQVKEMPDGFPFETTIKTETFGKGRTKYVFT